MKKLKNLLPLILLLAVNMAFGQNKDTSPLFKGINTSNSVILYGTPIDCPDTSSVIFDHIDTAIKTVAAQVHYNDIHCIYDGFPILNDGNIKSLHLNIGTTGTIVRRSNIANLYDTTLKSSRIVFKKPISMPLGLQDSITKYIQITSYYKIVDNKPKLLKYQKILAYFISKVKLYVFGGSNMEDILDELEDSKRKLEAEYHIKL